MNGLIRTVILVMATLLGLEGTVLTVERVTYHDPFAPYLAVMPGQSIDDLSGYPCRFMSAKPTNRQIGTCEFPADWGPFGQIVLTAYGHIITQAYLSVQPDQLHLGDLTLCWGTPLLETDGSSAYNWVARWQSEVSTDFTLRDGISDANDFLPVQYILIEGKWLPCHSAS